MLTLPNKGIINMSDRRPGKHPSGLAVRSWEGSALRGNKRVVATAVVSPSLRHQLPITDLTITKARQRHF